MSYCSFNRIPAKSYFGINPEKDYQIAKKFRDGLVTKSLFTTRYQLFRELLIAARKVSGMTQVQLAESLGRPQSFVSKFERGDRRLDVIEFLEICESLELDPHEVLRKLERMASR